LTRDCRVIDRSPEDPDPAYYRDCSWLMSFYTEDGRWGAALVHSEYGADTVPGMCAPPQPADLIHWSQPTLAVAIRELLRAEPGRRRFDYFSLLDPTSGDRNFTTVGDAPFVYDVRLDGNNAPYSRALFRRPIHLRVNG
jgi:hypothetical protein